MMANQRKPGFLADINIPLRDALRGVASLADATEDMLEPAAKLLPEPLRSHFKDALEALEEAGKRLVHAPIRPYDIALASQFLTGSSVQSAAIAATTSVIVNAWEHLTESSVRHRHMISETIVADHLSRLRPVTVPARHTFAAEVVLELRASSAIGFLPGLASGITEQEKTDVDLALLAIAVWLVSDRAESLEAEEKLLDLAMALVRALQTDAAKALGNRDDLVRFLDDASAHL